jgi:cytochrome c553
MPSRNRGAGQNRILMMKKTALPLAAACLSFAALALPGLSWSQQRPNPAPTGNAKEKQQGEQSATGKVSMCIGCHGIPYYKSAFPEVYHVPKIAGQSPQYIQAALRAYRGGDRSHPSMTGVAKGLSDQDIADLSVYYGGEAKTTGAAK